MARRVALLIGAEADDLAGVRNDLAWMGCCLKERGFRVLRASPEMGAEFAADYKGIKAALQYLVDHVKEYEAVVIYYSGHGASFPNPKYMDGRGRSRQEPDRLAFLVPTDYGIGGFNGLLLSEFHAYLHHIADAEANLAVILDCCFAAEIVRGVAQGKLEGNTVSQTRTRVATFRDELKAPAKEHVAEFGRQDIRADECLPNVIRLVACGPRETAQELRVPELNRIHGVLTAALCYCLRELQGATTTWEGLATKIRSLVNALRHTQRPFIKGPVRRLLFSTRDLAPRWGIAVGPSTLHPHGDVFLEAGAIAGVKPGQLYTVRSTTRIPSQQRMSWEVSTPIIALARVREVTAACATLELHPVEAGVTPKDDDPRLFGARAYLVETDPRAAVRVSTEESKYLPVLRSMLPISLTSIGEAPNELPVIAEVVAKNGTLEIRQPSGEALRAPVPFCPKRYGDASEDAIHYMNATLETIVRAHHLATLCSGTGDAELTRGLTWSIEYVSSRGREIEDDPGDCPPRQLAADESVILTVRVTDQRASALRAWFFQVDDVGVISLLSRQFPTGAALEVGPGFTCGVAVNGDRVGRRLRRPSCVPKRTRVTTRLVLIVTDGEADLSYLETGPPPRYRELSGRGPTRGPENQPGLASATRWIVRQRVLTL